MKELLEKFEHAIISGDGDASADLADAIIAKGEATPDDIFAHLSSAMEVVGGRYETGEYFIPEMLRSAEAVEKAMAVLEPYLFERRHEQAGVIAVSYTHLTLPTILRV